MSRVLVAFASKHGATAEIAEAIADQLRQEGHAVDCVRADEAADLESYDAAVIGSAVYMNPEAARKGAREAPVLGVSSGPCGEKPDPTWAEPPRVIQLAERLSVRSHIVFGGRLPPEPNGFVERAMVQNCPPDKRDLRKLPRARASHGIRMTVTAADDVRARSPRASQEPSRGGDRGDGRGCRARFTRRAALATGMRTCGKTPSERRVLPRCRTARDGRRLNR